jgi:hypothetical protein
VRISSSTCLRTCSNTSGRNSSLTRSGSYLWSTDLFVKLPNQDLQPSLMQCTLARISGQANFTYSSPHGVMQHTVVQNSGSHPCPATLLQSPESQALCREQTHLVPPAHHALTLWYLDSLSQQHDPLSLYSSNHDN